jgi:hypothetical protein
MKTSDKQQQVGRLAFRAEGDNWACYYAMPDTMENAVLIGTIHMGLVRNPERKKMFMDLMKHGLNEFIKDRTGQLPEMWKEEPAPDSERSGPA